jgi:hypothetical protein
VRGKGRSNFFRIEEGVEENLNVKIEFICRMKNNLFGLIIGGSGFI